MTTTIEHKSLMLLLHGDERLLDHLRQAELLPVDSTVYSLEHAETARVAGTLVHELEVNLSGVDVVLRMRSELVATRKELAVVVRKLRALDPL